MHHARQFEIRHVARDTGQFFQAVDRLAALAKVLVVCHTLSFLSRYGIASIVPDTSIQCTAII